MHLLTTERAYLECIGTGRTVGTGSGVNALVPSRTIYHQYTGIGWHGTTHPRIILPLVTNGAGYRTCGLWVACIGQIATAHQYLVVIDRVSRVGAGNGILQCVVNTTQTDPLSPF